MKNKRILLIDDSKPQRKLIRLYISNEMPDIIIDEADCRVDALFAINNNDYDLILLDYSMPTMTGLEFMRELEDMVINIPVVMITGTGNEEVAARAFKMGVTDYIVKSGDLESKVNKVVWDILFSGKRDNDCINANLSSFDSAKKIVKEYQKKLEQNLNLGCFREKMLLEFDSIDGFNSFSRWVLGESNINIKDIQVFINKYIVMVTISPSNYVCIP
ncbi:MAG: response regulator [Thermoplasmata archaeon]|nr:response regulator [Thermoplasmata archaeon]